MYSIFHRVGTSASPEKVFAALTTIDGLRHWWVDSTTGDAKKGGRIDFGFCDMEVVAAEPGALVQWKCVRGPAEWLGTEVSFRLRKDDETFIMFTHSGWKEPVEFMHHCSTKWGTFLLSLRDQLESGKGRPAPNDLPIHVHDRRRA